MTARSFRLEQTAVKCFTVSHRAQDAKLRPFGSRKRPSAAHSVFCNELSTVRFLTLHILGSEADLVLAVTMRSKSCGSMASKVDKAAAGTEDHLAITASADVGLMAGSPSQARCRM